MLEGVSKQEFNQFKFEYYKKTLLYILLLIVFSDILYWISDCMIFNAVAVQTIIPRCTPILFFVIYYFTNKKVNDYRIMIPLAYLLTHAVMWSTIWAIVYLPNKQHANEGFIIMNLMFLAVGLASPTNYAWIFHSLLLVDIIGSYPLNQYESIDMMIGLGVPALIGVELCLMLVNKTYIDKFNADRQLEWLALHDQLTGLYNRNILDKDTRTKDNTINTNATILLLDIDFFKKINDTYGHFEGDKVLKRLGANFRKYQRSEDLILRWGGEEFIVILFNTDVEEGTQIAENIRKGIEEIDDLVTKVTVSIGVAYYTEGHYLDTIKQADDNLYKAKELGRNRVVFE